MTVATKFVKVNHSLRNSNGQIFLPPWVRKDVLNLHVPDEAALFTQEVDQNYPIGAKLITFEDTYRYCKAGAAMSQVGFLKCNYTLVPGKAGNSANQGFEGAFYAAVAAGDTSFQIADTAAVENEYEGALLVLYNDTTNRYDQYRILGNDVTNATTTTLYIAPPGFKTLAATSVGITIYLNRYANVRPFSTGGGYASAIGAARMAITSAYFFWLKTAGPTSGLTGASTWPGQTQYYRDVFCNTDGSVITYNAGYQRVGFLLGRTASDYGDNCIMLQLDQ